jgi:hypothetical protein
LREALAKQQAIIDPGSANDFAALIAREFGRMKMALAAAGIEMN